MHREAIPESVWRLLHRLSGLGSMASVYLGGGTALAMQLGHRVSADLDFFAPKEFDYATLMHEVRELGMNVTVMSQTPYHCEMMVEGIKVDYLRETISPRFPLKTIASESGKFQMADLADIGRMKLHAIASRGSKKDFIDLYCLTRTAISLEELLVLALEEQETVRFNRLLFLKGLVDFEEAERDAQPFLLWKIEWKKVRADLTEEVKQIGQKLSSVEMPE